MYPDNGVQGHQQLRAKLDNGSEGNTLPLRTFKRIYPNLLDAKGIPQIFPPDCQLIAYGEHHLTCYGYVMIPIGYNNIRLKAKFYVVDVDGPPLLSLTTCEDLKMIQFTLSVNAAPQHYNNTAELKQANPNLFDRIGDFGEKFTAKLTLKPNSKPYIDPPRRYPIHQVEKIKAELDQMLEQGIIRRVTEHTEWCSSLAFATKADGSL
jgi:hypothetical protein